MNNIATTIVNFYRDNNIMTVTSSRRFNCNEEIEIFHRYFSKIIQNLSIWSDYVARQMMCFHHSLQNILMSSCGFSQDFQVLIRKRFSVLESGSIVMNIYNSLALTCLIRV